MPVFFHAAAASHVGRQRDQVRLDQIKFAECLDSDTDGGLLTGGERIVQRGLVGNLSGLVGNFPTTLNGKKCHGSAPVISVDSPLISVHSLSLIVAHLSETNTGPVSNRRSCVVGGAPSSSMHSLKTSNSLVLSLTLLPTSPSCSTDTTPHSPSCWTNTPRGT